MSATDISWIFANLDRLLADEDLRELFNAENPTSHTDNDFERELIRLGTDITNHHWDCKCLICS
jgi:hypothetical protein